MKLKLNTGPRVQPRRVVIYGVHGVGKSSLAAQAPNHVFLDFEDGLNDIDCVSTERIRDWPTIDTTLQLLVHEPEVLQWVVIDTLDWMEQIIHQQVSDDAGKPFADIGYGKGYVAALAKWQYVIRGLEYLRRVRGCGIIALAHADIKRFDSPEMDSYDRYQPAMHASANNLWMEWCDELFFAGYKVHVRKEDQGFDKERAIAFGAGERFIRTKESPAVLAKSRLTLPDEIPFAWSAYQGAIDAAKSAASSPKDEETKS
jgi:hypothetical protein